MSTKKSIFLMFSVLLFVVMTTGNASARSLNSAPGTAKPSQTGQNLTVNAEGTDICASVTEIPPSECEALEAIYNSTNGASWKTNTYWLQTNTPCSWYRVTCGSGHVTVLELGSNQLSGSIPTQLGNLTNLQTLELCGNRLSGTIPPELGNLTQLTVLELWGNQLSGIIPSQLGKLTNLQYLDLDTNQLSGSIPTQLGNLTNLQSLWLYGNQLSGSIPSQLGNLTNLTSLIIFDNQLSGSLPASLESLTKLQSFAFENTSLCEPGDAAFQHWLKNINFVDGTNLCTSYTISGSLGAGGANATLTYTGGLTSANSSGNYTITVPSGWSGKVTPTKTGLTFYPASYTYSNVLINQINKNYTALVTISGNAGDAGVVLHYTNGTAKTVTSASNGRYSFTVPYHWSGTVTPTKTGVTFTPASRTYTSLAANQTNQNYADIVSFASTGAYDGRIRESAKGSGKGGSMNATDTTFTLGDYLNNCQWRAILSFGTASLPDTAVVQSAVLKIKIKPSGPSVGTSPFTVLGTLYVDIRTGYFGSSPALELADFNAPATAVKIGSFGATPVSGWYSATLNSTGRSDINKTSLTQLRLYFSTPTNNNNSSNYVSFFSGNARTTANQPQLIVTYSLP